MEPRRSPRSVFARLSRVTSLIAPVDSPPHFPRLEKKRPTPSHLRHNPAPGERVKRAAVAPRASSGAGGSPRPAGDPKDAFEFVAFLYSSPEPCAGRGSVPRTADGGRISAAGFLTAVWAERKIKSG